MSLKEKLKSLRAKLAQYRLVKSLYEKFKNSQIIPVELLTDVVLRKVVINFIKRAEEKGWTNGINLPEEVIADYFIKIIRGEHIHFKEQDKANKVLDLIKKSVFNR